MSNASDLFRTGGALQGAAAASLLREHQRAAELKPGDRVGLYRIVSELGRGGMAIVYRAERADGEYEQQVALKWMLDPRPDSASEALFRHERQSLADLRHPNIARLIDGGRSEDGRPWFAMELIEGERIDQHCHRQRLSLAQRLQLFRQVCAAVAFAHARGLIHRDIKPSNVLIDADGSAKLLDFGISQLLGKEAEASKGALTPGYASPEQLRGEAQTVASDVFQLGLLLRDTLQPESHGSRASTATAMPPREVPASGVSLPRGSALPGDLEAIIAKSTAAIAEKRHPTAEALSEDLRAFAERRPVSARPRTALYLTLRFVQRHPLGTYASLLVVLLVSLMTASFTISLKQERDTAEHQARIANTVLEFLREDLLAAAAPSAAPGRELTVRDALDTAADAAGRRFADAPVELTAIRTTLAWLYLELGRFEEGEAQARLAQQASADQELRPSQRFSTDRVLIRALIERGDFDQALELARTLADRHQEELELALAAEMMVAWALGRQGHYAQAEKLQQLALQRAEAAGIESFNVTIRALKTGRGDNLMMLGRHAEALELAQSAHTSELAKFGELHPDTLDEANRIGQVLRHMGRLGEAESWQHKVLQGREQVYGADHPKTLSSANELATVLQELRRFEDAEPLFQRVLEGRLRQLGEQHIFTRNSMSNLALLYSLWDRPELAAPLYERALAIELSLPDPDNPDTLALMHNVAGLYRRQGRFEDALAMHAKVVERAGASLGPDAWQLGLFHIGRAQTLQRTGALEPAEDELQRGIAILVGSLGEDHARVARAREMLATLREQRAVAAD